MRVLITNHKHDHNDVQYDGVGSYLYSVNYIAACDIVSVSLKVVHSKSSGKREPDFESGSEQLLANTDLRYVSGYPTYSEYVDASTEWQRGVTSILMTSMVKL